MKQRMKIVLITTLMILIAFASFNIGQSAPDLFSKLEVFNNMIQIMNQYYVDKVDWDKVMTGAYRGMMAELDPHSVYLEILDTPVRE